MAPLDDKWKMTLCTTSSEVPIDEGNFSGPVSLTDGVRPENDDVNYLPCGVPLPTLCQYAANCGGVRSGVVLKMAEWTRTNTAVFIDSLMLVEINKRRL